MFSTFQKGAPHTCTSQIFSNASHIVLTQLHFFLSILFPDKAFSTILKPFSKNDGQQNRSRHHNLQKRVVPMRDEKILKLTLAAMLAALAFICFTYLRIEIPMGGGMTGKIYIGAAFILLSGFLLGGRWGGLTGAIGLSLGDVLVGYATSAPPTFLAKLIFGLACGFMAHQVLHLAAAQTRRQMYTKTILAGVFACLVNVLTEPVIRWAFKVYVLGLPEQIAYLSAVNCAISMAVNSLPSIAAASFLYAAAKSTVFRYRDLSGTRQIAADQQDDTAEKQEPART
jgi:uncharacterized membrane protein